MRNDGLNVHVFQNRNWCSPKSVRWYFFQHWLSVELSIGRILSEKKHGGAGLLSENKEALYAALNEEAEAGTSSYSATGNLLQYIYSTLITKNYQKIQSRSAVHEFFFIDIF